MKPRVCELFAGVGGFRLALERSGWKISWSNQWEPRQKAQYASDCYIAHFGPSGHTNQDIATVDELNIPDHELLVGGFPCQDYSVATTKAEGIHGKKGVLWWEINRILEAKRPPFVLLENVDRLLRSPTVQRGRDFAVMLWCLNHLGYGVEWRVINAADYGAAQKRRRTFILAAHGGTLLGEEMAGLGDRGAWLRRSGFFSRAFPVLVGKRRANKPLQVSSVLPRGLQRTSDSYKLHFRNSGLAIESNIWTTSTVSKADPPVILRSVLEPSPSEEFFVPDEYVDEWRRLKGAKAEKRRAKNSFEYRYTEGAIPFPDSLDRPARTIVTGEGGVRPSRFKHIIQDPSTRRLRILTPLEVERLNEFPDGWTETGMPPSWRYFCMGNALVVGLIERMGRHLLPWAEKGRSATQKDRQWTDSGTERLGAA